MNWLTKLFLQLWNWIYPPVESSKKDIEELFEDAPVSLDEPEEEAIFGDKLVKEWDKIAHNLYSDMRGSSSYDRDSPTRDDDDYFIEL